MKNTEKNHQNQAYGSHMLYFDPFYWRKTEKGLSGELKNYPGITVNADGSVHVMFYAPGAGSVVLTGIGGHMQGKLKGEFPLVRCTQEEKKGYWETVLSGIKPGFHYHRYLVDGKEMLNTIAPVGFGCGEAINFFEVPDPDFEEYLLSDVPHGTVRMELFPSSVTGRTRCCWVYTPPGYDDGKKEYPLLFLQHGGGENECGWIWQGKINYIMDNLLAAGACREMIVVMSCGDYYKEQEDGTYTAVDMDEILTRDCLPFIEKRYRALGRREARACAGLSLGGTYARRVVFRHPETFCCLGMFSSGAGFQVKGTELDMPYDYTKLFEDPENYNEEMKLTFISCGEQDFRIEYTRPQVKELTDRGFHIEFHTYPGYHEWDVWRKSAADMIRRLFVWL